MVIGSYFPTFILRPSDWLEDAKSIKTFERDGRCLLKDTLQCDMRQLSFSWDEESVPSAWNICQMVFPSDIYQNTQKLLVILKLKELSK